MTIRTLEMVMLGVSAVGALCASFTDIRDGKIYNQLILVLCGAAIVIDAVYYSIFAKDLFIGFTINICVCAVILLCLFYTHSFAGGDVKLGFAICLLYPAGCYLYYRNSLITLFFALCFGILIGYLYLLIVASVSIIRGKTRINGEYVKKYLRNYFTNYLRAFVYVVAINLFVVLAQRHGININAWLLWALCFVAAWSARRIRIMKNRYSIAFVILLDIVLSITMKTVPFSIYPSTYAFIALLVLCQITITSSIYKEIPTDSVEKGMILSAFSTIQMQGSRVRGLPGISREDLRDRITQEQAESVKRWGRTEKGADTVVIMRKIPFAVFLTMGFLAYFLIWSAMQW